MARQVKLKLEATKLRAKVIELTRENTALKTQLFNWSQDMAKYREMTAPVKVDPNPLSEDKEFIELLRVRAWVENTDITEYLNDAGDAQEFPDGWPTATTQEQYIAEYFDREPSEASEPTGPMDSILHGLLHGK